LEFLAMDKVHKPSDSEISRSSAQLSSVHNKALKALGEFFNDYAHAHALGENFNAHTHALVASNMLCR
jgi:hypothetical protein